MDKSHVRRQGKMGRRWGRFGVRFEPLEARRLLAVNAVNDTFNILEDSVVDGTAIFRFASFDPNSDPNTATPPGGSEWKFLAPTLNNLNQDGTVHTNNPAAFDANDATWFASPLYSDAAWSGSGASALGFARPRNTTNTVPFIDTDSVTAGVQKNISTYFRRHVTITQAQIDSIGAILVQLRRDDGAAVYLNGHQIIRSNLAANAINTTLATDGANGDGIVGIVLTRNGTAAEQAVFNSLVPGDNVLAAEVHQVGNGSSDILFDLDLVGLAGTTDLLQLDPNFVSGTAAAAPPGADWKYLDTGVGQDGAGTFVPTDASWFASPSYSDAAWSGPAPAPLGYNQAGNTTNTLSFGPDATNKFITTYFRRALSLTAQDLASTHALLITMRADDGAVVYLNGFEIQRVRVAAPSTSATLAGAGDNGASITFSLVLPGSPAFNSLHVGDNTLAAEVHQTLVTSSDVIFDLGVASLRALVPAILQNDTGVLPSAVITVTQLPANGTLRDAAGATVALNGVLSGGEFTYTPNAQFSGSDSFIYRVDNGGGDTDTATVNINIQSVNDPPVARNDYYTFSEGSPVAASVAATNPAAPIPAGSTWKYLDNGSNQDGTGFMDPVDATWFASKTYNDAAWASGAAELGYGDGDEATVVSFGPDAAAKFVTTYFRRTFNVSAATSTLYLQMKVDDGAAVYINGKEVARVNLPGGALFDTLAGLPNPGDVLPDDGEEWISLELSVAGLGIPLNASGTGNIIAVEMHQATIGSSDISFDMQLSTTPGRFGVLKNDSDPVDNTAITASLVDGTALDAVGTLTFNPNGTFSFTPDTPGLSGTFTFTYHVTDNGTPLPPATSNIGTVTIVIQFIDAGPITTNDDTYNVHTDATLIVSTPDPGGLFAGPGVLANDTVLAGDEQDPTIVTLFGPAPDPATQGTLTLNADGTFTFVPVAGFQGTVTFQYQVNDGFNAWGPATVTINFGDNFTTVNPDNYSVNEDTQLNVNLLSTTDEIVLARNSKWDYNDQIRLGESYPVDGAGRAWNDPLYDITTGGGFGAWVPRTDTLVNLGGIYSQGVMDVGPSATALNGTSADTATYLFRSEFTVANANEVGALRLTGLIDDSAIIYINGKERLRVNMPAGVPITDTYSGITGNEAAYQATLVDVSGDLVNGVNSIAVELHNTSNTSSDAGFDGEVALVRRVGILANDATATGTAVTALNVLPGSTAAANGTLNVSLNGTFTYQPNANFNGTVTFQYTVTTSNNQTSQPTLVTILVDPQPDVTVNTLSTGDTTPPLSGNIDDPLAVVRVTVDGNTYSATNNGNGTWSLPDNVISPALAAGVYNVSARATDANFDVGTDATNNELTIGNANSTIAGRFMFYNRSGFDGTSAVANALDDAAIDTTKTPLLGGQTATFANYSGYLRGLNGIMFDVAGAHGTITAADIEVRTGNTADPTTWALFAGEKFVSVRAGAGVGGSDRVTLTLDTNLAAGDTGNDGVKKQWVRFRVLANGNTNLLAADVFYFGNAVGEVGNNANDFSVETGDEVAIRANPRNLANPAPVTFRYDIDHDTQVNAGDQVAARGNRTNLASRLIKLAPPPEAAAPAGAALADAAVGGDDLVDILARGRRRR